MTKFNENCDDEYCPGWGIFDVGDYKERLAIESCDVCAKDVPDYESGMKAQRFLSEHKKIDLNDLKLRQDSWNRLARVVGAFAMSQRHGQWLPEFPEVAFIFNVFSGDDQRIIEICDEFMRKSLPVLKEAERLRK